MKLDWSPSAPLRSRAGRECVCSARFTDRGRLGGADSDAVQVFFAVIYCLFAAGVVFGYAAIKPVLVDEKVYRYLCTEEELERDVRVCYQQDLRWVHCSARETVRTKH